MLRGMKFVASANILIPAATRGAPVGIRSVRRNVFSVTP
jgi:hypothetical protein